MIAVIVWELRRRRAALMWWLIGSLLMTLVILALYPSIRDQAAQFDKVISQLPPGLRALKTGSTGVVDVGDPAEFLNSQLFYATLPIIWIILAITRGAATLGREEASHTIELLLARPISRSRLLTAKATELFIELLIVGSVIGLVIVGMAPVFDIHIRTIDILAASGYTAAFSLSFGYIAFALQAAGRFTKRAAVATAVGLGFGGYIISSLSTMTDWLQVIVKLFPYHYFTPLTVLHGNVPRGLFIYLGLVLTIGSLIAWLGFRTRDID